MGISPQPAPQAVTATDRLIGTDSFEFVEFAGPDPQELRDFFTRMGCIHVATHKAKAVELWQQGEITYLLNAQSDSFAARYVKEHGASAPSMGWRVADAQMSLSQAVAQGEVEYTGTGKVLDVPAIVGIGGALIYFVDHNEDTSLTNWEYI